MWMLWTAVTLVIFLLAAWQVKTQPVVKEDKKNKAQDAPIPPPK